MDLIVIRSNDYEKYQNLVEYLEYVFPECEIRIVSNQSENLQEDQAPIRLLHQKEA